MNPTVEVLPPEETQVQIVPAAVVPAPTKKKPKRIERELQKQALGFYYSLGDSRTLARVAQEFKVKESLVISWSSAFNWKKRVQEMENRSTEDEFKERAMGLLVTLLNSFSKRDEATGEMVLTAGEKSIVERLKLAVDAFTKLRADSRDQEEHGDRDGSGRGPGKNGPPRGVMVNVIFKG